MTYQSRARLLGLPLVDITMGRRSGGTRRVVARGWIAVGDVAFGVLFSAGAISCGAISVGGLSLGLFAIGGVAFGVAPVGGLAAGLFAFGGAAFGWFAAAGGLAVSHDVAYGGHAIGGHANDPVAREFFRSNPYFRGIDLFMRYRWLLAVLLGVVLLIRLVRRVAAPE